MKILCIGDIVGQKGIIYAKQHILKLIKKNEFAAFIINIENSAENGKGPCVNACIAFSEFKNVVFTGGNHSFGNKYFTPKYEEYKNCIRPCNFSKEAPGDGYCVLNLNEDLKLAVINVQLRTFMREQLNCPFRSVESILSLLKSNYKNLIIIIDLHGEATAEKLTFASYFDGKVTAIFGTHTHVQTNDGRVFPKGTGYITDIGMTGALNSSLGVKFDGTIFNFITQLPTKFVLEEKLPYISSGVIFEIEEEKATYKTKKVTLLNEIFE